jgi:hypothetical protein
MYFATPYLLCSFIGVLFGASLLIPSSISKFCATAPVFSKKIRIFSGWLMILMSLFLFGTTVFTAYIAR